MPGPLKTYVRSELQKQPGVNEFIALYRSGEVTEQKLTAAWDRLTSEQKVYYRYEDKSDIQGFPVIEDVTVSEIEFVKPVPIDKLRRDAYNRIALLRFIRESGKNTAQLLLLAILRQIGLLQPSAKL